MPLSHPAPREALHRRTVECRGFRREDGLWDIEGHLIDTKSYDFPNQDRGGTLKAGEPIHEMWVRLTIDVDFMIHHAEAVTDWGPFTICGDVAPDFAKLAGHRIGGGFLGMVKKMFAGPHGCTHIVELMGPVATTAFQTLFPARENREATQPGRERPAVIDTCHALAADGPIVARHWPEFGTAKSPGD
ncbi:MAG: DUF2889 domain-containing protein [Alphaproteobacteria bacterium]|nr:DUF2889 domain-containing protein [Alphaproteobacteria bacterium]